MMTLCILSAHASGQVFKGDAILTINGSDVTRMTVNEVAHLIATSRRKVTLHLARPSSEGRGMYSIHTPTDNEHWPWRSHLQTACTVLV
jgi:hypothetical protein